MPRIYFVTTGAVGVVQGKASQQTGNGLMAATGINYKMSRHTLLAADVNFDSYPYTTEGVGYKLQGTLSKTALGIFLKYNFGRGNWLP